MAKSSKKTVWLITAVIFVVMIQLVVIGFILANGFSQVETPRRAAAPPQPNVQRTYTPQTSRPITRSPAPQPVRKTSGPQPKPTGPRAEPPQFSKEGGVYTNTVTVQLKAKAADATIRYTLDGSAPGEQSATYSAPIAIQQTTLLRAVSFQPGLAPSVAASEAYTMLGDDLLGFTSNLPLVIINTFNQPVSSQDYYPASVRFINASNNRATLTGPADFDGTTDLKRRGFSSLRYSKMSFTLKTRDDDGEKAKAPVFGLPSESDWVLYGPYVDKTLMRDALAYELSNQMGRYAPRTRFVEAFVHRSSGKLTYRDYAGVYLLVEKVKRGKDRVDIAKLKPEDNQEPEISGGYILKRDHGAMSGGGRGGWGGPPRPSDDGVGFITPRRLHLFYVEPNEDELTPAQKNWMTRYVADFERSLYGGNFASPTEGYAKYLDVDAFIDHFWLVELSKNVDGFRYSAFLYKPRGGKLTMGPAWDWNLSFGNADYYDGYETSGWYYDNLREIEISWIYRLKQDPDFMQRATDRWTELRRDVLATDKILRRVDAMSAQLQAGQTRNFRRWPVMGRSISPNYFVGDTFDAEVNWMKTWIKERMTWIDRQFPQAPALSEKPGRVAAGTKLTLRAQGGDIFYTLDGTDPRAPGGAKSSAALQYKDPIVVKKETRIITRVRRGSAWSGPTTGTFTTAP